MRRAVYEFRVDGATIRQFVDSAKPGGAGGIRTPDLFIANEVLAQLSYKPTLATGFLGAVLHLLSPSRPS